MFDTIGKKMTSIFQRLRSKGILTEADVDQALRELRIALLEADVALPALKAFLADVRAQAIGQALVKNVAPDQLMVKIVHDALLKLLTHPEPQLKQATQNPTIIVMAGLQGSGKTTMAGKLAYLLHSGINGQMKALLSPDSPHAAPCSTHKTQKVLVVSVDAYRPAAKEQLAQIAEKIGIPSVEIIPNEPPLLTLQRALNQAKNKDLGFTHLIVDTAGRMHVDAAMMHELHEIVTQSQPTEILLVTDAMTGQDALATAQAFCAHVPVTGLCLSRVDADSRGGAALSLRYATQLPIKLMGTGESPKDVHIFDAQRLADRILDRGDIVGLVEKAVQHSNQQEQERAMARLQKGIFTLDDMATQLRQVTAMGGITSLLGFLPGIRGLKERFNAHMSDEKMGQNIKRQLAIISAMTPKERRMPMVLNASRKRRIAAGSGTQVVDVNRLLTQYEQMQKMMQMLRTKMPR